MSEVLKYYNYLHTIPEPSLEEYKTAAFVADKMEEMGYQVMRNIAGATGVVGVCDSGKPGPVLALRADMDSLTHVIDGKKVQIHSCGHDSHTAMLLAAAKEIMADNVVKKGKLKIIFQPAEETGQGAKTIVEGGVIDDVDMILGMHIRPVQECRKGEVIEAMRYSASCIMKVVVTGSPAHGARPHLGINAIDAAVVAVNAVNAIRVDPRVALSIKCTRFLCDAGVANAIPSKAMLNFDLRADNNDAMHELQEKFKCAVKNGTAAIGATVQIEKVTELPAAILDEDMTLLMREVITETLGKEAVRPPFTTPGGEDFFWYAVYKPEIKSGFVGLGVDAKPGLHHPDMSFDTSALENGVAIHKKAVEKILG